MNQIVKKEILTVGESRPNFLKNYDPMNSMYFSSVRQTILATGQLGTLMEGSSKNTLGDATRKTLQYLVRNGNENPMVIGSIPFESTTPHGLRYCTNPLRKAERDAFLDMPMGKKTAISYSFNPTPEVFLNQVERAKEAFTESALDKVVLSRSLDVFYPSTPNIARLVSNLHSKNKSGYTFSMPLDASEDPSERRVLIGASPELLISKFGRRLSAFPLAGSEPRSTDPLKEKEITRKLMESQKDRYEHDLVIQSIEKALRPYCKWLHVPKEPSLMSTSTMWHLGTRIEGELISDDVWSIDLAQALHPTPAVGGYPTLRAKQTINQIESYSRDHYAGAVGWCDSKGDGEWAVTIRCAQIQGEAVRLYAGAGIVKESSAEKELAETAAKFNTMLNALELEI